MTYESTEELPDTIRDVLPERAQEIYVEAYNETWEAYDERWSSELGREGVANREAWANVKQEFVQDDDTRKWYPKGEMPAETEGEGDEDEDEGLLDELTDVVT
jgi:cation transport regulator